MAALAQLQQEIFDIRNGYFLVVTKVKIATSSDTVALPGGLSTSTSHVRVLPIDSSDTAATVASITQSAHPGDASVTLTNGTVGSEQFVVSLHVGNVAGL
ncbi:MAG TPA: hypothetical protein DCS05_09660 [Nitrospiraceae bacterium]|nr:hypothetical protein [Nitrospiraceae bacterium]